MDIVLQFVPLILLGALYAVPVLKIAKRAGMSKGWGIVAVIPMGVLLFVWVFAYEAGWGKTDGAKPGA